MGLQIESDLIVWSDSYFITVVCFSVVSPTHCDSEV